ncbi:SusC/RagA family TonB-linked outer membrane protein [Capnocytophaga sp.]|uniref:SusC/RagA family TonB-linked outer membrane protein n=1 Tax=Capnocytophaga sp. TaxID=44737 RepID=UPI0026DC8083|nr:SusC/RagA family TonB-linked outer membrane protein [Capnocytophaga sp.]MDO5105418.1 SusC/RagA family TonB-linked outer membrane protein [Capnocytophaga sp.]
MRERIVCLVSFFFLAFGFAFAQEKTVTGTVKDEGGVPLSGVTVTVKGTTRGVATDFDGHYTIKTKAGDALTFTAIGFATVERSVTASTSRIDVTLQEEAEELGEVVVTAYGTQSRASVAGSVQTIKSDDIAKSQSANVIQSLTGKAAGVQVRNTSGQPGEGSEVRFRGIGSISASNNPLYVVDGIPFNGDISSISLQDIESITFLKDASANALYGSRGANGVIVVTTKKGSGGKLHVTYETKLGMNTRAVPDYDIITDPREYYQLEFQRRKLGAWVANNALTEQQAAQSAANSLVSSIGYNVFNVPNDQVIDPATGLVNPNASLLYQDDWHKALFGVGIKQEHYLSLMQAGEKVNSYLSIGYLNEDGYVLNSGFDRVTARANLDFKLNDNIKVGTNLNYAYISQKSPQAGKGSTTFSNLFSWTRNAAPIFPIYARDRYGNIIYNQKGEVVYDFGKGQTENFDGSKTRRVYIENMNPYATTLKDVRDNDSHTLGARAYASINFLKDFNFTYNVGYDLKADNRFRYGWEVGGDAFASKGSITNATRFSTTLTNQQLLSWKKVLGKHSIDLMIGHESQELISKMLAGNKTNVVVSEKVFISNASKLGYLNGYNDYYQTEGYLSKLNYGYGDKYYINASYRRDASSVFHPDHRWGDFYGVGAAWVVTNESFIPKNNVLNHLKLKASYGEQGNDNILYPAYVSFDHRSHFSFTRNYKPYLTQYDITPDAAGNPSIREAYLGNKDLKWEVSKNFNTGFEAEFFGRVNLEFEYFKRSVSDMLYNFPQQPSSGNPSISKNIGNMENKGFEVTLGVDIIKKAHTGLNVWANATHYKNKVTKLPDPFTSGNYRFAEGKSAYTFYIREFVGVDEATGRGIWNQGKTNENGEAEGDKTTTMDYNKSTKFLSDKTAHPDVYGGFGLNFNYKNWAFSTGFAYQIGGYNYDSVYAGLLVESEGFGNSGHNLHKDAYKTWNFNNKNATLPRLTTTDTNQFGASDLFLTKADYISWENASISYKLANDQLQKLGVENITFSLTGSNLWVWTKRQGFDPRMTRLSNGGTENVYSLYRTVSFGLSAKF